MTLCSPLRRQARLVAAILCLAALPAFAQFVAKTVTFEGAAPYSQADLQAAAKLKPGDSFTQEGLQKTAQTLQDTGVFASVQAAVNGPPQAMAVTFKLQPRAASQMLPVTFVNFPSPSAEVAAELHKRVPLFNGTLPEAGTLQATAIAALEDMLAEKQNHSSIASKVLDSPSGRTLEIRIDSPAPAQ